MIEIDFENLRAVGLSQDVVNRAAALPTGRLARVVEAQRDCFTVHDGMRDLPARAIHRLVAELQQHAEPLTIGDWVAVQQDAHGDLWIEARVPPVTQIARRANDGRRQPLASNVDTALLVMGLDADFNPRRMERYIAMVRACDVAPVVVLTKADIATDARDKIAEMYRRLPATTPVLPVNGLSAEARNEISPWLHAGQTIVLLGSSGAGKSTLTNTLAQSEQPTGEVRKGDGRGRHTTTARSMHMCPQGACIIDTPGLRTWRPDADAQTLAATFDDVSAMATQCQFRDCRHEGEPGCAVRGAVDADRLANYHKLLRDAHRVEMSPLERIEQRQKWKAIGKAGTRRVKEKTRSR